MKTDPPNPLNPNGCGCDGSGSNPSNTATTTSTSSSSATSTSSASVSDMYTRTPIDSASFTASNSESPRVSNTLTPSWTVIISPLTPTRTGTPSDSSCASSSITTSTSPSFSVSPSPSLSYSVSPSVSSLESPSLSASPSTSTSFTASLSASSSPLQSFTSSPSSSSLFSTSESETFSSTISSTLSVIPSISSVPSPTTSAPSSTPSISASPSLPPSLSPSISTSPVPSLSPSESLSTTSSASGSSTFSPSCAPTDSSSHSISHSPSLSPSSSLTMCGTDSISSSLSHHPTPSPSFSISPTTRHSPTPTYTTSSSPSAKIASMSKWKSISPSPASSTLVSSLASTLLTPSSSATAALGVQLDYSIVLPGGTLTNLVGTGLSTLLLSAVSEATNSALASVTSGVGLLPGMYSSLISSISQYTSTYTSTSTLMGLARTISYESDVALLNISEAVGIANISLFAEWSNSTGVVRVLTKSDSRSLALFLYERKLAKARFARTLELSSKNQNITYICGNTSSVPSYNSSAANANVAVVFVTVSLSANLTANLSLSLSELIALMTSYLTSSPSSPINEFTSTFFMCTGNTFNERLTLGNVKGMYLVPTATETATSPSNPVVPDLVIWLAVGSVLMCTCCCFGFAFYLRRRARRKKDDGRSENERSENPLPSAVSNPMAPLAEGSKDNRKPPSHTSRVGFHASSSEGGTNKKSNEFNDWSSALPGQPLPVQRSASSSLYVPSSPTLRLRHGPRTPSSLKKSYSIVQKGSKLFPTDSGITNPLNTSLGSVKSEVSDGEGLDASSLFLSVENSSPAATPRKEANMRPPLDPFTTPRKSNVSAMYTNAENTSLPLINLESYALSPTPFPLAPSTSTRMSDSLLSHPVNLDLYSPSFAREVNPRNPPIRLSEDLNFPQEKSKSPRPDLKGYALFSPDGLLSPTLERPDLKEYMLSPTGPKGPDLKDYLMSPTGADLLSPSVGRPDLKSYLTSPTGRDFKSPTGERVDLQSYLSPRA